MSLPIEATPTLDEESWIHLCKMMEYWETHPEPAPVPEIAPEVLDRIDEIWRAKQAARLNKKAEEKNNNT